MNIKDILEKSKSNTAGLLKTSNGNGENGIYKIEIFDGLKDDQIKHFRTKIRKYALNLFESIIENEKNEKNLNILIKEFISFYKETYKINDFSFASVASENTKNSKKDIIIKALKIIEKSQKKS